MKEYTNRRKACARCDRIVDKTPQLVLRRDRRRRRRRRLPFHRIPANQRCSKRTGKTASASKRFVSCSRGKMKGNATLLPSHREFLAILPFIPCQTRKPFCSLTSPFSSYDLPPPPLPPEVSSLFLSLRSSYDLFVASRASSRRTTSAIFFFFLFSFFLFLFL